MSDRLLRSRTARLILMGLVPVLLTACDARRDALVYTDAGACTAARVLTDDECTRAAQTAGTVAGVASPH